MKPRFNKVGLYISIFIVGLIATGNDTAQANCGPVSEIDLSSVCPKSSPADRNFTFLAIGGKSAPNLLILAENGTKISPIGLEDAFWNGPGSEKIKQMLAPLFRKNKVFSVINSQKTRHGHLSGQIVLDDGTWVQHHLLERGLARFAGGIGRGASWRALLKAEETARKNQIGLWKDPSLNLRDATDPGSMRQGFSIIEGVVHKVTKVGNRLYLNFGVDWRQDFSAEVSMAWRDRDPEFPLSNPKELENKRVRLRGIIRWYNGPYMPVRNMDQLEILPETSQRSLALGE